MKLHKDLRRNLSRASAIRALAPVSSLPEGHLLHGPVRPAVDARSSGYLTALRAVENRG
jgi:hypothetical protein